MYISSVNYKVKEEEKCTRIFRPWDAHSASQDSTVSTTTETSDDSNERKTEKTGFRPILNKVEEGKKLEANFPAPFSEFPPDGYAMYPELYQASIAQSLGLTPSDPLFLESMAQGYALEEYARVLNQEHQTKILQQRKQRPKKYKCPHCDVGFSNNGQLKGHIRIHTGERPFKCEEKDCGKTFTRNEELTRHKRIHSGLRPYPCTQCGKRFGRKDHLKKHSRTHFQPRGVYAVPVMLPFDAWASSSSTYPFVPMYGY